MAEHNPGVKPPDTDGPPQPEPDLPPPPTPAPPEPPKPGEPIPLNEGGIGDPRNLAPGPAHNYQPGGDLP